MGIIDNITKNFRPSPTIDRNTESLKEFEAKIVDKGNHIVIDWWIRYDFLEVPNSEYIRTKHIRGGGDFGYGRESISHIEFILTQLETKFLEIYHSVLSQYFLPFIREIEFKLKTRKVVLEEK